MTPKVSVIMPVYQVERYLPESLDSVRKQTLQEIEIICVDDGSTDACPAMLDRIADEDPRFRVVHNENHGYGYSVNEGFKRANGEYLAIFEPDDVMPEDALETLYHLAERYDADLVKGDYCELRTGSDGSRRLVPARLHPDESFYGRVFCAKDNPAALLTHVCVWGGVFRRELIESNNIRLSETPGASFQDVSLFFPLLLCSQATFYTHHISCLYRNDNPNASTKNRGKLYFADQEYIRALDCLKNSSDDGRLISALWCARWRGALGTLWRIDPSLYKEFLHYMRPVFEPAWKKGLLNRKYCNAYQWAMLKCFLQGDAVFMRAFRLSNGKIQKPVRLWWRFRYNGISHTLKFLKQKKDMQALAKNL